MTEHRCIYCEVSAIGPEEQTITCPQCHPAVMLPIDQWREVTALLKAGELRAWKRRIDRQRGKR